MWICFVAQQTKPNSIDGAATVYFAPYRFQCMPAADPVSENPKMTIQRPQNDAADGIDVIALPPSQISVHHFNWTLSVSICTSFPVAIRHLKKFQICHQTSLVDQRKTMWRSNYVTLILKSNMGSHLPYQNYGGPDRGRPAILRPISKLDHACPSEDKHQQRFSRLARNHATWLESRKHARGLSAPAASTCHRSKWLACPIEFCRQPRHEYHL